VARVPLPAPPATTTTQVGVMTGGMTIRIYRIAAATGERTELLPRHEVEPSAGWEIHTALDWPPCRCPRCLARAARLLSAAAG
jgi:hypothetical protein